MEKFLFHDPSKKGLTTHSSQMNMKKK